jgi:hypothetical protein
MRDLKADLEICKIVERAYQRNKTKSGKEIAETAARIALGKYARQGWSEAIERATKAEDEVKKLEGLLKDINEFKDELFEAWRKECGVSTKQAEEVEKLKDKIKQQEEEDYNFAHHAITGD